MAALPSETPEFFPRGPSPLFRLTVFGLMSIALMFADARYGYLEGARRLAATLLAPVQRVLAVPGDAVAAAFRYLGAQAALIADNQAMRGQLLAQATAAQGYELLRRENESLRELLRLHSTTPGTVIAAEVLYTGRDPFSQKVVVDKGDSEGVQPGMAVIDERGVVGQVTRVYRTLAEVTLITDKDHLVPVQVLRSGVRTVLHGTGSGRPPELRFLPANADIQPGDRLVTSGIDGVYPRGLAVADVMAIDRNPAKMFAQVTVQPVAGVERSRHLLLLSFTAPPAPAPPVEPAAGDEAPRKAARGRRR